MSSLRPDPSNSAGGAGQSLDSDLATDLAAQLEAHLRAPVTLGSLTPFGDGHSGFTYAAVIASGGRATRWVVRLSPAGARIAGPADIGRQGRIMEALWRAGMPVPRVIAYDSEPVVDNRSYAVIELVEGVGWEAAAARHSGRKVAEEAASFLRRMQRLEPEATGIGMEPEIGPAAEVERWTALLERGVGEARGPGSDLAAGLAGLTPVDGPIVLNHGDFHYGNMLFGPDGRLAAVIDWEIASLGHPLGDFGCLMVAALRGRYAPEPNPTGAPDLDLAELAELHEVEPSAASWATAAACLKYGSIISYNLELHRQGKRLDPLYEELQGTMVGLLRDGAALLEAGDLEPFRALV